MSKYNISYWKRKFKKILTSLLPEDIQDFNYAYFKNNYESIDRAIQVKMIGADINYELINDLNLLKQKIEKSIPSIELNEFNDGFSSFLYLFNPNSVFSTTWHFWKSLKEYKNIIFN